MLQKRRVSFFVAKELNSLKVLATIVYYLIDSLTLFLLENLNFKVYDAEIAF